MAFRKTCQASGADGLGVVEPAVSCDALALSALLELAGGMEALMD